MVRGRGVEFPPPSSFPWDCIVIPFLSPWTLDWIYFRLGSGSCNSLNLLDAETSSAWHFSLFYPLRHSLPASGEGMSICAYFPSNLSWRIRHPCLRQAGTNHENDFVSEQLRYVLCALRYAIFWAIAWSDRRLLNETKVSIYLLRLSSSGPFFYGYLHLSAHLYVGLFFLFPLEYFKSSPDLYLDFQRWACI